MSRDYYCSSRAKSLPQQSTRLTLAAEESSNMMALLQDCGQQLPPTVPQKRVGKLGRIISKRGETCQWISSMTEVVQPPLAESKAGATPPGGVRRANVPPEGCETSKGGLVSECIKKPGEEVLRKNLELSRRVGDSPQLSLEERLESIHLQQQKLLEQERVLQDLLRQQGGHKSPAAGEEAARSPGPEEEGSPAPASTGEDVGENQDPLPSESTGLEEAKIDNSDSRRRRLKGTDASLYAKRDEGSIGSLIWNCEDEGQNPPSSTAHSSASLTGGREANLKQERSSAISQLLSQTSFSSVDQGADSESTTSCTPSQTTTVREA